MSEVSIVRCHQNEITGTLNTVVVHMHLLEPPIWVRGQSRNKVFFYHLILNIDRFLAKCCILNMQARV